MERALANVFVPSYNLGVMVNDQPFEERVSWRAGFFRFISDSVATGENNPVSRSLAVAEDQWRHIEVDRVAAR